ncbi:MAG: alkaline phosphatase family protein [Candidatus Cybelea sp.]
MPLKVAATLTLTLAVAACNANGSFSGAPVTPPGHAAFRASATPIQHVIFIIQENRSFNNFFLGYPGAKTQNYGYDTKGNKIALQVVDLVTSWDIDHFSPAFFAACDGQGKLPGTKCKMDGWNNELAGFGAPANFAYSYVPEKEIDPYWKMAQQYVLADRMFSSNLDGSFIAHQFAIAAYADKGADSPYGSWGCEGGSHDVIPTWTSQRTYGRSIPACFDIPTIGSEADTAGVTWRFYTGAINADGGLWSSYQANRGVYKGPDWTTDVINPPSQFLADIAGGTLANVTWITPTYANSDHPGIGGNGGPAWVASLVNAIGTSQYWKSSAIFIMWDDWGGWFDPVKPVHEDYAGLGFRVPLLMVSPYAKRNYVTHVQYETASVLKFMESTFGLAPLARSDARANDPTNDAFDYTQKPRAFKKFAGAKSPAFWALQDRAGRGRPKPKNIIGDD